MLRELKLNVLVSKVLPRKNKDLVKIIARFQKEGLRFGLYQRKPMFFELWREALPGESTINKDVGIMPGDVIEPRFPQVYDFSVIWHGEDIIYNEQDV